MSEPVPSKPLPGEPERLGPYRVVGELGRGGMAVVYLGERADGQFEQRVALKVLAYAPSPAAEPESQALRRFERERQILASLEHPGIARLLDGGITEQGRPWFAMEHVEGERIDAYCDRHHLDVESRLRLFVAVTRAVAAAHRQLVVHRDIKPSNILVSRDSAVKLLDFGIAKLLDSGEASPAGELTQVAVPMTRRYASPEQAGGGPVTTASDIFQLGLLLEELLAGLPSATARGDLEAIVATARRPEPNRRYESASSLAEDVERFLSGRPVTARPDSPGYRAAKFLRRNRWGVAASAAVLAAITGLSIFYTVRLREQRDTARREQRRATAEAEKARQVAAFLGDLFKAADPYKTPRPAERTALELLDEGAKKIESGADGALERQPEVKAAMLHTIGMVYRRLGQYARAEPLLRRAVELRRQTLGNEHADTLGSIDEHGIVLRGLQRLEEALALSREALSVRERRLGAGDPLVAVSLTDTAHALERLERRDEARPLIERAVDIFEHASPRDADRLSHARWLLGAVLANSGDPAAGIEQTRLAIALLRDEVDARHPRLANLYSEMAHDLHSLGRIEESRAAYQEAIRIGEERFGAEHAVLAWIRISAAEVENELEHFDEALALVDRSLEQAAVSYGREHYSVGMALQFRAEALLGLGRAGEALEPIDEALEIARASFGPSSVDVAIARRLQALVLSGLGRREQARAQLGDVIASLRLGGAESEAALADTLIALGEQELELGDARAALAALDEAVAIDSLRRPAGSLEQVTALAARARGWSALGDRARARAELARALALASEVQGIGSRLRQRLRQIEEELAR